MISYKLPIYTIFVKQNTGILLNQVRCMTDYKCGFHLAFKTLNRDCYDFRCKDYLLPGRNKHIYIPIIYSRLKHILLNWNGWFTAQLKMADLLMTQLP